MRRPRLPLLFLLLVASTPAAGQEPARTHDITVADYVSVATMIDPRPSPDGRWVVYVDSRWAPPSDRRNADP